MTRQKTSPLSWIDVIEPEEAGGLLAEIYADLTKKRGKVANIMKVHSLHPRAMKAHLDLYLPLMFGRHGLSRAERELVATVVSYANRCAYCAAHHGASLNAYWKDDQRVAALARGPEHAGLTPRERAIAAFADKLTRHPGEAAEADLDLLRAEGLSDAELLNLTLIVGYFNFVNRIALGLGVVLSPEESGGYDNDTHA